MTEEGDLPFEVFVPLRKTELSGEIHFTYLRVYLSRCLDSEANE